MIPKQREPEPEPDWEPAWALEAEFFGAWEELPDGVAEAEFRAAWEELPATAREAEPNTTAREAEPKKYAFVAVLFGGHASYCLEAAVLGYSLRCPVASLPSPATVVAQEQARHRRILLHTADVPENGWAF